MPSVQRNWVPEQACSAIGFADLATAMSMVNEFMRSGNRKGKSDCKVWEVVACHCGRFHLRFDGRYPRAGRSGFLELPTRLGMARRGA